MLVEKCNWNLVPPAGCSYVPGSHESLLFLLLGTEPCFVGEIRKKGSSPNSAVASHQNTITGEAAHPVSYLERSGVDELVLDKGFMLFWTSLLCVVMPSIDASIKVQLAALGQASKLSFGRWEELGAPKRDWQNPARWTRDSQPSHREMLGSEAVSNPGCPGGLAALGTAPQPCKPIYSLTKESRPHSFRLKHTKKAAAALLPLMYPKPQQLKYSARSWKSKLN